MPRILKAEFAAAAAAPEQLPPPSGVEVVFAGRSNVGKSSLMNCLLGRKNLVRTSGTPGCTRQINFFDVETDRERLVFVDLPGYGYAKRSKTERQTWAHLIHTYLLERPSLRTMVLIVDVRRGVEADDEELIRFVQDKGVAQRPRLDVLCVATKLDKVKASARKPALKQLARSAGLEVVGFSAKEGFGRQELWDKLVSSAVR